jgi:hypothetical protein
MSNQTPSMFLTTEKKEEALKIQVGVDFGTSSTKIAYAPIEGQKRIVIPFLSKNDSEFFPDFCFPSLAAFTKKGDILFGHDAFQELKNKPWSDGLKYLKVVLAGKYDPQFYNENIQKDYTNYLQKFKKDLKTFQPEYVITAYLIYLLTIVKEDITHTYESQTLDLIYNICVPIDQVESSKVLKVYEKILATAECILKEWNSAYFEDMNVLVNIAKDLFKGSTYNENDPETRFFVVPETVAQISSYLKSMEADPGIHAVIDVGAGTTDVSIFSVVNPKSFDSKTNWYAASNIPLGAASIERVFIDYASKKDPTFNPSHLNEFYDGTCFQNGSLPQDTILNIHTAIKKIKKSSDNTWGQAYGKRRKELDWLADKIKVFMIGGGKELPFIKSSFSKHWLKHGGTLKIRDISIPEEYEEFENSAPFKRMAVAYGLTIPKPEMGHFILPKDCPDCTPAPLPKKNLPDRDELYPK